MTLKKIISRMKQYRPISADEFEQMIGARLDCIGEGCFREVFRIEGINAVIKFPMQAADGNWSTTHSRREIRRIKQIMCSKKYRHVKRYVPRMHHYDYINGILIMQLLYLVGEVPKESVKPIQHMLKDTFPCINNMPDAESTNLGYDGRGQIKVLDWGCV
jgi:hypothetical protein